MKAKDPQDPGDDKENEVLPRKLDHRGGSFSRTAGALRQESGRYRYWETPGNRESRMLRMNR